MIAVVFDIPERLRGHRDAFRTFLKKAGFRRAQQSAWLTDRAVSRQLADWVRAHELGKWVRVWKIESGD